MKRELWYSVVVRDRHGKVISRERRKSRSFVRQWNDIIYLLTTDQNGPIKCSDGTSPTVYTTDTHNLEMKAAIAESDRSTVVGSGNTAVTISDFQLETQIAEGTGAGQLNYQAGAVAASVVSAPTCGFLIERAFVNNSGGDVTARESAIYAEVRLSATFKAIMIVRDVFGSPQVIPDGGSLVVNYTLRVSA